MECSQCFGKAQNVKRNEAAPCRQPSPVTVVNLINEAYIPARYTEAELKTFANRSGNCTQAIPHIIKWQESFHPYKSKGLVLSGPVGVGKTYILAALAKSLLAKGIGTKFIDFFQLISEIKGGYMEKKSDQTIISPLVDVEVLIIDELGKGRNTDFELTVLDQIIMGRYNQNKTIIASTNCSLGNQDQELRQLYSHRALDQDRSPSKIFEPDHYGSLQSRVGNRVFSRLVETTEMLSLTGHDFRATRATSR
tara:strand:+ start:28 stop:780 length:753 start_codon:yes stop_codon:yes gene_type:complete